MNFLSKIQRKITENCKEKRLFVANAFLIDSEDTSMLTEETTDKKIKKM